VENPRAKSSNNFRERTFIFGTRLARQFEFGGLFVTVRQKRSLGVRRQSAAATALWMK